MVIRDDTEQYARPGRPRHRHPVVEVRPGETLAGRFVVGEILGVGATGTVFSALDRTVGQKVAIKILHPDLHDDLTRERLRREVRASRNCHPNAVAVYDLHEADGHVFLSMELVEGRSLRERLDERSKLEASEVVNIGRQIADALAHLHDLGIIHRDIKPGNILLVSDGTVKLCDMGLARPMEEGMTVTETAMVVGTPAYMAPEQGLGSDLTSASDIYGLGLTLYQCLTGEVPLTSDTAVATLTRRQRERPPALRRERPECPSWLNRLIRRMLEPRPRDRPSAARVALACETARIFPCPRTQNLVAASIGVIIFVAAAFAGWSSVTHRTVGFDLDQDSVFGIDGKGDPTWTYTPPVPPFVIKTTDLDGNGRDEVVVTGPPTSPDHERPPADKRSYVTVLSADGELVTTAILEDLIGSWRFPYRVDVFPNISFEDLDGDGWNEIIATCHHHRFYPSALIVYWPKWDVWDVLLRHPGAFLGVAGAHENGRTGLRFIAHNNLLGMTKVYGEIDVIPPGSRPVSNRRTTSLVAPPEAMQRNATVGSWRTYIPFAPGHLTAFGDDRFVVESEPELVIGFATRGPTFDQFFNPIGGPNAGLDLREARLQFAESLHLIGADTRAFTRDGVETLVESIRTDAGPLMNEMPYELVFSTLAAKALAGVGDAEAGIALLEKTRHLQRDDDLLYRLAHLYAVHGEPEKAQAILQDTANNGTSSRARFDVPVLMLQIAIAQRDENDVAAAIAYLTDRGVAPESKGGLRNSLAARTRLWWDTATPTDAQVRTVDVDGDGDAVACLIRWRLGIPVMADAERMRVSIDLNPDGFNLGTIALAAALVAQGRPDEAIGELDRVIGAIARSSRWDFTDSEILKLAQAVRVVALETTGDTAGAAAEARRLAPQFDADLLPGKLVHEVLDRTNS